MRCPVLPPDPTPREALEALADTIRPVLKKQGRERYCNVSLWLKCKELRRAIRKGEDLILFWPDGSTTLHLALSLAILEPIPTPQAQRGADYFRHELQEWRGEAR
jgi:hypothetical protein